MRLYWLHCYSIVATAFLCGCDSGQAPVPAVSATDRERIIAERKAQRAAEAASLTDVQLDVAKEPVPVGAFFGVAVACKTNDPLLFQDDSPDLIAQVIRVGNVIESEEKMTVERDGDTYNATCELRSPPRPGEYEVRLVYVGADRTLASTPLKVGGAE